jgi:hypothetical protein
MSRQKHDSQALPVLQEVDLNDAIWDEVVAKRLPANLEEQARTLGAWSRQRGLRSVSDLLRALLVYVCCQYSWRELGMWAVLKGIGSLSQRAWRKRLDRSQAWIAWLLGELLGVHQTPSWLPPGRGRVLLVDATRWKIPAGTGDDVRLHQSYDLRAGKMDQVAITDRHQAESLTHFRFQPGDLVVTDAGYQVGRGVELTQESQSVLLQRTTASHLHLEEESGKTITLKEQVKLQPADSLREVSGWVRLPKSGQRAKVRVVCYRLPEEQARKARQRKEARLRKKQGNGYNRELVWWASWVILVTTADKAIWSGQELVFLYRARWQIELFFKRLKQCLRLHQFVLKDWKRVNCVLQLMLIVWALQEQEAEWMREQLMQVLSPTDGNIPDVSASEQDHDADSQTQERIVSSWRVAHFCCEETRTMLRGAWSRQRKQDCQAALQRYVFSRKRKRRHRESEQRAWLEAKCFQIAGASLA